MCFSPHIRRVAVLSVLLISVLSTLGCSAIPEFELTDRDLYAENSVAAIPPPDFDKRLDSPRVASESPGRGIVSAPEPFRWDVLGRSAGDRPIHGLTVGQGGYRTLVIGSLAGNDPMAVSLTESFARHIHENSIILGGITVTAIRTANPDGEARQRIENGNSRVLNRQFSALSVHSQDETAFEPEVQLIIDRLDEDQPQRVIHIRTYPGESGVVAASQGAATVAKDVADWLNMKFMLLPGRSREGTLERYLSEKDACDIITFAIPESADESQLWVTYGDCVLNLLLGDDYETRKLARTRGSQNAADIRNRKGSEESN